MLALKAQPKSNNTPKMMLRVRQSELTPARGVDESEEEVMQNGQVCIGWGEVLSNGQHVDLM